MFGLITNLFRTMKNPVLARMNSKDILSENHEKKNLNEGKHIIKTSSIKRQFSDEPIFTNPNGTQDLEKIRTWITSAESEYSTKTTISSI